MTMKDLTYPPLNKQGFGNAITFVTTETLFLDDIEDDRKLTIPARIEIEIATFQNYGMVKVPIELAGIGPRFFRY